MAKHSVINRVESTVKEIAKIVEGELKGNGDIVIKGASGLKEAKEGDISFISNPKYMPLMAKTEASCLIISKSISPDIDLPLIYTDDPSLAFSKVISHFSEANLPEHPSDIHPTAILGKDVALGKNVSIGAGAIIGDRTRIGDESIVYSGTYIGHDAALGKKTLIYPNVTIREHVNIGSHVIIHSGSVIGSDGFGFTTVKGVHQKIPQIGTVVIEDDVEIGANVTIDRARFGKTLIGKGTKIDNLVQIAHNVEVGDGSIIVAQAGISGSTKVGKNVILAGQSGIVGHIEIGDNVIVAAGAGVVKSVPANTTILGQPAKPHRIAKRILACIDKLPDLFKKISGFESKLNDIENKLDGKSKDD